MEKVRLWVEAGEYRFKFPVLNGMREWATDDMGASFTSGGSGWFYSLPQTPASLARIVSTCPLLIDAPGLSLLQQADDLNWTSPSLPAAGSLPQPARRKFDQWGHQKQAYWFTEQHRLVCMLGMKMGTGKSKVVVDLAINKIPKGLVLVFAPARVLAVWRREVEQHGLGAEALILDDSYASTVAKVRDLQRFVERKRQHPGLAFVVVNFETAIRPEFAKASRLLVWDMIVVDESHRAKSPQGATSKMLEAHRLRAPRRLLLTGTPMPHSPADLYSQFRFLNPGCFGTSFVAFKKRYCIEGFFKEIVGWRRKSELRQKFHSLCVCIGEDVLDLPPLVVVDREFPLPPHVRAAYKEFWEEYCLEVKAGLITADNTLVKYLRGQQIICGFGVVEDPETGVRTEVELDDFRERELYDALLDLDPAEKVVVFCRFRYDLEVVRRAVEKREYEINQTKLGDAASREKKIADGSWRHYRCGEVSGRRSDLTDRAKLSPDFEVFAVQVQSGGVGVDFTDAAVAFLYSTDFNGGNYEQLIKRLHRPGQKRAVRIVQFVAVGTIDRRIYAAIREKRDVVSSILSFVEEVVCE